MKISTVINLILLGILTAAFSGCGSNLAQIDDTEAFYYIKKYEAENQQIIANNQNIQKPVKWIQAANKKEACKLYVGYNPNDDRTLKSDFKIFWDGSCKNGYAYGLGREFERGFLTNMDAIGLYSGGEKKPEYFIQKDNLENKTEEGDINNGNFVITTIKDDGLNFDITYQYGHFQREVKDNEYYIFSSPFSPNIRYIKGFNNYGYVIDDISRNEFDNRNYNLDIKDLKTGKYNGFSFVTLKNGSINSGEIVNGSLIRRVQLPQSYLNNANNILSEIKNAGQVALDTQKKALMVKQQYKDNICKDSVKVDFIDNNEYKAICNENEKIAQLKIKIDAKLAQIEQQNQAKRQQQNQQRVIQVQEAQAMAAQRQAAAAETANFNQSLQNLNNNLQMQQLNNNLMMNNMMPKRYDIYVH